MQLIHSFNIISYSSACEYEIMEDHVTWSMWQPDFMTWLPISQLLSSEKAQFADANFPDGVGK